MEVFKTMQKSCIQRIERLPRWTPGEGENYGKCRGSKLEKDFIVGIKLLEGLKCIH